MNNIGGIYANQGNYPLALEYYQKSLKIQEAIGNKKGISNSLNSIGIIYNEQGNYPLALEYYQKSLKIGEEIVDKQGIAQSLNNIGIIYNSQGNYPLALEYYQKSLKIQEAIGNKQGIASNLTNIGVIYQNQGNYSLSLEYHQKSLKIYEEIGFKLGQTYSLNGFAQIAQKQKDYDKSIEYAQKGLQIAQEIKAPAEIKGASKILYNTYKLKGDYVKALEYHELYKTTNDSIFNVDKAKKIANLEATVEIEKKAKEIELLNKNQEILKKDAALQHIESEREKDARKILEKQAEADKLFALARQEKDKRKADSLRNLAQYHQLQAENLKVTEKQLQAENQAQKIEAIKDKEAKEFQQYITYLVLLGLFFVVVFAYFIFRSRQKEKKAKEIISQQKEEVSQINEEITQINNALNLTLETVNEQKNEIEQKTQAIEDSILYAQRIQQAILPLPEYIAQHLPSHFVLFKPRDVVSGDFYYFEEKKGKIILAAIDCTGHGIPGAFMTMIASEILNEIIQHKEIVEADFILNELHKRVRIALKQQETQNRDGMDLSLVVIDKKAKTMAFAGAKNPMIYIQNNEIFQLKGDKMPIGGEQTETERIFAKQAINIAIPTTVYLFSDGYQDQFGGANNKKFMIAKMRDLFLQIHQEPLGTQKGILDKTINNWIKEGNEKQIDDILVIGLKLDL